MKKLQFKTNILVCWECNKNVNKLIKFENGKDKFYICKECLEKAIRNFQI